MSNKQHSIEEFKVFVRNHPSLVKEVRRGIYTWQEVFEDWYLLGEQNEIWDGYRDATANVHLTSDNEEQKEEEKAVMSSLFESLKNVDVQSMQKHVSNLSQALGTISGVISQFQSTPTPQQGNEGVKKESPLSLRKD